MLNISKSFLSPNIAYSLFKYISYKIVKDSTFINFDINRENSDGDASNLFFKIRISDITNNTNFDEQTIWAIDNAGIDSINEENTTILPKYLIPILPKSHILKQSPTEVLNCDNTAFLMFFRTKDIEDLSFRFIVTNPDLQIFGDTNEQVVETQFNSFKDLFSTISTTTQQTVVNAGDDIIVNVTCSDNISTVYLEPITGYLPKTRVKITNKTGSFVIKTDGLNSGDIVSVKLGHKYFTGAAVFNKTLA